MFQVFHLFHGFSILDYLSYPRYFVVDSFDPELFFRGFNDVEFQVFSEGGDFGKRMVCFCSEGGHVLED